MTRYICIHCGTMIRKSAMSDPYMCRDCEKLLDGAENTERFAHLDNYQW